MELKAYRQDTATMALVLILTAFTMITANHFSQVIITHTGASLVLIWLSAMVVGAFGWLGFVLWIIPYAAGNVLYAEKGPHKLFYGVLCDRDSIVQIMRGHKIHVTPKENATFVFVNEDEINVVISELVSTTPGEIKNSMWVYAHCLVPDAEKYVREYGAVIPDLLGRRIAKNVFEQAQSEFNALLKHWDESKVHRDVLDEILERISAKLTPSSIELIWTVAGGLADSKKS